jgi:hypothetical protein
VYSNTVRVAVPQVVKIDASKFILSFFFLSGRR